MKSKYCILNIDVYKEPENGSLCVRFDILNNYKTQKKEWLFSLANLMDVATSYSSELVTIEDYHNVSDTSSFPTKIIMEHLLAISSQGHNNSFEGYLKVKDVCLQETSYNHASITYKLPKVPHLLIHWIACYTIYINSIRTIISSIQFNDYKVFNELLLNASSPDFINTSGVTLIQKIISFKPTLPAYEHAISDLEKIYVGYATGRKGLRPKSFLECISESNRNAIVYSTPQQQLANAKNIQEKIAIILSYAKAMECKEEFFFMIDSINTREKIVSLISPCLNQFKTRHRRFNTGHPELKLFYFAEFYLFSDGRLGIINLDKNPMYTKYYAPGQEAHAVMHEVFKCLENFLQLYFEPGCDFHKENKMLFTQESSLKLMQSGLHINANYCKDLLKTYTKWAFFTRIYSAKDTLFSSLPNEIFDAILAQSDPAHARYFHECRDVGFFNAIESGRKRGQEAYEEYNVVKEGFLIK